jgi:hypothetical protein
MRWLIAVALDGATITYGEIARKLETEQGFSTIFDVRIGFIAGTLVARLQEADPHAPLINVLVVNQKTRMPSEGAGPYMADRFGISRLRRREARSRFPKLWKSSFERAIQEVQSWSADDWARLYGKVFGEKLDVAVIAKLRRDRKRGAEKDGIPQGRKHGSGGEGPEHRALRLWAMANPAELDRAFSEADSETEADLDSGDRVDVVYRLKDRIVLVEVKSRTSDIHDLRRGVYQCVKYRAVREAMDVRTDADVQVILLTEHDVPMEITFLLKLHGIRHCQVPALRS